MWHRWSWTTKDELTLTYKMTHQGICKLSTFTAQTLLHASTLQHLLTLNGEGYKIEFSTRTITMLTNPEQHQPRIQWPLHLWVSHDKPLVSNRHGWLQAIQASPGNSEKSLSMKSMNSHVYNRAHKCGWGSPSETGEAVNKIWAEWIKVEIYWEWIFLACIYKSIYNRKRKSLDHVDKLIDIICQAKFLIGGDGHE